MSTQKNRPIFDTDVLDPVVAELDEFPSLLYREAYDAAVEAWEWQRSVQSCCAGTENRNDARTWCGHNG